MCFFDDGMQNPRVWGGGCKTSTIDREGSAIFLGTPAGHNHFFDILQQAKGRMKNWF